MKEVTFLEKLAENLLEGGFVRALKPKLQPVQIAKALAREMERSQMVGPDGPLVANRYLVHLHPDDLAAFSEFQAGMERELATFLRGYAARHGLKTLASPTVSLIPADPPGTPGRVRVKAALVDPGAEPPSEPAVATLPLEGTIVMPSVEPRPAPEPRPVSTPRPKPVAAHLVDETGQALGLTGEDTSIGRAVDNDIVLEIKGVSRHHARIVWEMDRYVLLDLGSTNGSFVSGNRVTRQPLSGGEAISLGGASFTFRLADPQE